jgi:thiamine-phosphate pyrophosphorylase
LQEYLKFLNTLSIPIAQYRNKAKKGNIKKDLTLIKDHFNGTLILNDYIEWVDFADGLHLGQEDLLAFSSNPLRALELVRKELGSKILGVSTHNKEEIELANSLDLDYIGLGAYRTTQTKKSVLVAGEALLELAKISKHKVALIGGVKLEDDFSLYPQISYKVIGSDLIKKFKESV